VGNPRTVHELCVLVQTHHPSLVFLSETWQSKEKMERFRYRLGLRHCFAVGSGNKGGGTALYWDDSIDVFLQSCSERHIDVLIKESPLATAWRATFVYGQPRVENRHKTWDLRRTISSSVHEPWAFIGDLNEAMWQFEHFSKTKRNERQMELFRDMMETCNLEDLGFMGLPWTYDNRKAGD
jgi:hypothetical protein